MRRVFAVAVLAFAVLSAPVGGQQTSPEMQGTSGQNACAALEPGDQMTLISRRPSESRRYPTLRATYQRHDASGLTVRTGGEVQTFLWSEATSVMVRCRLTEPTGTYAGTGALIGAGTGILVGAAIGSAFAETADLGDKTAAALGAGAVGLLGTLIGFALGSDKPRDRDWRPFPRDLETARVPLLAIAPGPVSDLRFGLRLRLPIR